MKLEFDLELLELALNKGIDLAKEELFFLENKHFSELQRVFREKEDILEFLTWYQPLIVTYLKLHKDQLASMENLALRITHLSKLAGKELDKKFPKYKNIIGNDLSSTITIFNDSNEEMKDKVEILFQKDSEERPSTIAQLLEEFTKSLENNFNRINHYLEISNLKMQFLQDFLKNPNQNNLPYVKEGQKKNTTYSNIESFIITEEV
jgi:hypothetical protein